MTGRRGPAKLAVQAGRSGRLSDRGLELVLLLGAILICVFGYAETALALTGKLPAGMATTCVAAAVLPLVCHVVIRRFAPHADPLILPLATLLSGLGLVLIHRLDLAYAAHY
ncbi:FtsW/RodA/SpoVE family cell cycle protein, partial [Streptomyces mirabilis]